MNPVFDEIDISSISECKDQKGPTYGKRYTKRSLMSWVGGQLPDPGGVKTAFRIFVDVNKNTWVLMLPP